VEHILANATFPAIAASARGEPGTLQFDWFFSDYGTQCVVRETFESSDAVLAHLGHVGQFVGRLIESGGGLELDVFGEPSATLREAIASFQPVIYSYAQGK